MNLPSPFSSFRNDEDGAVTVDWVVITAAVVSLAIATLAVVSGGVEDLSGDVSGQLANSQIKTTF